MRLKGIKHTLEKPLKDIKGITGLYDELHLSKKAYAKLKSLERQASSKEDERPKEEQETEVKESTKESTKKGQKEVGEVISELIDHIRETVRQAKEQKKPVKISTVIALALVGRCKFWMSDHEEAYISLNSYKHMRLESKTFKDFLQNLAIASCFKTLGKEAVEEIISYGRYFANTSVEGKHPVFSRVGLSEENFIEVNLLKEDHKVLRISKEGIELDYPRLKFVPSRQQLEIKHFDPEALKEMQNRTADELLSLFSQIFNIQTKEELALLTAWMIKTFYPKAEFPILAVLGEREGVGKTTFSKFISLLLDPTTTPIKTFPKSRDDLFVIAKENFLLIFDNLSHIDDDMSDALCQLSTGGSLSKRKLYTDHEVIDIPLKRPIVLNSIFNIVQKRDLRRRCIVLELKKPTKVRPLEELENEFKRVAPYIYAYLIVCVQEALKEKTIDTELLDLADFCKFVAKAHPKFFMTPKEFVETLKTNREEVAIQMLESNLLVPIIEEKLALGAWQTTATELLKLLKEKYPNEKNLPTTANQITKEIKKIASDLEAFNIKVEFIRTPKKRWIIFYKESPKPQNQNKEDLNDDDIPF